MKIAFTSSGHGLEAPLDPRFGRAPKFVLYDFEAETFEIQDNGCVEESTRIEAPTPGRSVIGRRELRTQGARREVPADGRPLRNPERRPGRRGKRPRG